MAPPRLLAICNPENRRTALLAEAARQEGWMLERISYRSVLNDLPRTWPHLVRRARNAAAIRFDSPAEDEAVERALLLRGAPAARKEGCECIPEEELDPYRPEHGQIVAPRQYYLGYADLLRQLETSLPNDRWMNSPDDVLTMFDKPSAHARLCDANVRTTPEIGVITNFEQLSAEMIKRQWNRVFVKIANGSSASGVAGIEHDAAAPTTTRAITTVETERSAEGTKIFNSLRPQVYQGVEEVTALVHALAGNRLWAEQWLPKARDTSGDEFDLRVLMIAGQPTHVVMRSSSNGSPMTNLHLGNRRTDVAGLREQLTDGCWENVVALCQSAAAAFPEMHYAGWDVLVAPDGDVRIIEGNAYGDLLGGVVDEWGFTPQRRELREFAIQHGISTDMPHLGIE